MLNKFLKIIFVFSIVFTFVQAKAGINSFINAIQEGDKAGIGKWQEFPFGKIRLISCADGVKDSSSMVGGVQVQLLSGWHLKKPILNPVTDQASFWTEAPLLLKKESFYTGNVFFPITYDNIAPNTKDFEFGVQGEFPVCHENECLDIPIRLLLPLPFNRENYTTMCAYILQEQMKVPQPAKVSGIKGYAWKRENGESPLFFTGIQNIKMASLYPTKENEDVSEIQLEPDAVFMRLKKNIQELPSDFVLLTNNGSYRIPVEIVTEPVSYSDAKVVSKGVWLIGWELFFLTPLLIWWGLGVPKNSIIWKKQIIKFALYFPVFFVLKMLFCHWGTNIIDSRWYTYFSALLLGIVCVYPPQKWYWTLWVFLIWPLSVHVPKMSVGLLLLWGILMLIEVGIPYVFLYLKASEIGKYLREKKKKQFFTLNFCFLLPTTVMFIMALKQVYDPFVSFSEKINLNGLTVVCSPKKCTKWQKLRNTTFINSKSTLGKNLKKIYHREEKELILWNDQKKTIVFPPNISVNQVSKLIEEQKNYHVLDKP